MDYIEQDNGASGSIPEFGAIFMSNFETQRECFHRNIFALPSSKAEFVKHIKAGMVLFLFEFKKRQLFGVYQASSNGAMHIVPHAFNYSGKRFPAQVCFTRIWHCDPLPEKEFRDAIRENYFSAKKFNFGLSEDQVRRLLYLFSSRKLKNTMPHRPLSETVVEVAGKDRRLVEDGRSELSERGFMKPVEYDEFNPAAFCDHHVKSFTRAKEEVLVDDGIVAEGKLYPYSMEDFLAKRRRFGDCDKLINDVAENGIYNRGTLHRFRNDSPKDCLDELRRLPDGRGSLSVERINGNQVDGIDNHSEYLVNPLDVLANAEYRFMQRSRLIDEYNMHNGAGQAFESDHGEESLDKIKHAIDYDKFLFDNAMQREYNPHDTFKPVAYGDGNLNLFRKERELIDDQESLINRKLEKRYNLDRDGSPIRAFEHSASPLHKFRKNVAAGRLPINDSEPDFGTSSVEGFSSEKLSRPLQHSHMNVYDRKYSVVEGRSNGNTIDNNFSSAGLANSDGYVTGVDRRVINDGKFRKIERADNKEDFHMRTNPAMSMEYHSSSQLKPNLSSFSHKMLPEKGLPQSTVSHNFDPSRSTFDDATITRAVPYSPDHPSFSHGHSASIPADQNSNLVRKTYPDHSSLGTFYSPSKNGSPQYFLESEKLSRPFYIAPEFGNKRFPTNTSRHQSFLSHEPTSSFANSNLPVHSTSVPFNYRDSLFSKHSPQHTDLEKIEGQQGLLAAYPSKSRENPVHRDPNISAPVDYRGSMSSKLSSPHTDLENIGGEQGLFAYPSRPRDNHLVFNSNLPTASLDMTKHAPRHELDVFSGQDYSCSGSKDFGVGIPHPKRDLASQDDNQYFRSSSNLNPMDSHKVFEAPHANSYVKRRSVFSRLSASKDESKFGIERNDTDFNHDDCYMDASVDDVMEMLQQGGNQSQRNLRKSRVAAQPTHGENAVNEMMRENAVNENMRETAVNEKMRETAVNEKKTQSHMETNHSVMEKNKLNDASLGTADSTDEVPKETRVVDFKRRSERRKNLVRITADSDTHSTSSANEVKSSMKTTLKRQKLVRPVFSKTESATDAICNNGTLQNPPPSLAKDDKQSCETAINACEAEVPNDYTKLSDVLAPKVHLPVDCINNECKNPEEQKDVVARVLPSEGHETTNIDLQISSSQVPKETTQQKSFGIQTSAEGILAEDIATITDLNLPKSSLEGSRLGAGCGNSLVKEKNLRTKKRKKKIIRTHKVGVESLQ